MGESSVQSLRLDLKREKIERGTGRHKEHLGHVRAAG